MRRVVLVFLFLVVALAVFLVFETSKRRLLLVHVLARVIEQPGLLPAGDEGPEVRWVDDYFTVERIDARTFAIGEPRYYQQNFNYLIVGRDRAVLFDAGPGVRDIRPIAESLTELPITFIPSHFHYDHLGDGAGEGESFASVAVVDLPRLRDRAPDGRLRLTSSEHVGFAEGFEIPTLQVTEWLAPGAILSLGERDLRVLYTPGHTDDSISLLDLDSGLLFSGDFLYPGPLFAMLPNSSMGEYLSGAEAVLGASPGEARVLGAHRGGPPGLPELAISDVLDLKSLLEQVRDGAAVGEGAYPVTYRVNDRVTLLAEPRWLQRWGSAELP